MADRSEIISRLRALRAKAADEASSEAEAEAAARRAAKIIEQHQVAEAELIERGTGGIEEGAHNEGRSEQHPALKVAAAHIGALTECLALEMRGQNKWVGQPEDVAFALYLAELIQGASERSYKTHWQRLFIRAPDDLFRRSYLMGFGMGVSQRLDAMTAERAVRRKAKAGSTDLVAVKDALIKSYMAEKYPAIKTKRRRQQKPDLAALLAGARNGAQMDVAHPLEKQDDMEIVTNA